MNAFACDPCPAASAQALADRHVVKMALETAQVLSTVARDLGHDDPKIYRPTHRRHPVTVAAVADPAYRGWLVAHGLALCDEYARRFGRVHASRATIERAAALLDTTDGPPAAWPMAMPDEFRSADPHASYRRYLAAKYRFWGATARWTNATRPEWAQETLWPSERTSAPGAT